MLVVAEEKQDRLWDYGDVRVDIVFFPNINVIADAHRLPFRDECLTQIVGFEILEHLESPFRALKEFKRVLKSNGRIIITIPNLWEWRRILSGIKGY